MGNELAHASDRTTLCYRRGSFASSSPDVERQTSHVADQDCSKSGNDGAARSGPPKIRATSPRRFTLGAHDGVWSAYGDSATKTPRPGRPTNTPRSRRTATARWIVDTDTS